MSNLRKLVKRLAGVDWWNVRIIPEGAGDRLPPVPYEVEISEADKRNALKDWNTTFPEYAGMLEAEVEDG